MSWLSPTLKLMLKTAVSLSAEPAGARESPCIPFLRCIRSPVPAHHQPAPAPLSAGDCVLSTTPAGRDFGPPLRFHRCCPRTSHPEQAHRRRGCTRDGGTPGRGSCRDERGQGLRGRTDTQESDAGNVSRIANTYRLRYISCCNREAEENFFKSAKISENSAMSENTGSSLHMAAPTFPSAPRNSPGETLTCESRIRTHTAGYMF